MRIAVAGGTGTVGRHVSADARGRGHDVVPLTRSTGHDLRTGSGLATALEGVDVVVDVSGEFTTSAARARSWFGRVTRALLSAEIEARVPHHVALSIVGIDAIDAGYYAGKLEQERLIARGPVPWSLLRATQFHEFAEQIVRTASFGPLVLAPAALLRPVAAREVASRLVDVAVAPPAGRVPDLRGPRAEDLARMVRRMLAADHDRRLVLRTPLPGAFWAGMRSGSLRGTDAARSGRVTFDEWLVEGDRTRPR
jgi:uncharacterized protein YbjT (DUF2867 family)